MIKNVRLGMICSTSEGKLEFGSSVGNLNESNQWGDLGVKGTGTVVPMPNLVSRHEDVSTA
jgi:hypothetical protein